MLQISVKENVTLITFQNIPSELAFIAYVFEEIAAQGINVDMIAESAHSGGVTDISFTVDDDSLGDILKIQQKMREIKPQMGIIVSGGNTKISVFDESMSGDCGVAAKIFRISAELGADIRMITTSEVDISLLVTQPDAARLIEAIEKS